MPLGYCEQVHRMRERYKRFGSLIWSRSELGGAVKLPAGNDRKQPASQR